MHGQQNIKYSSVVFSGGVQ